ncbi:MAG: ribosomal protein S18-alanine N-acetyltransferase [Clostridia bacterium]|nr:ribosomal protein S18-alanine N-acetyltransferase [Clostridia bacterium]
MYTLRDITPYDCKALVDLESECFSAPWTEGLLVGAFARVDFYGLLIEENGEILGYICGTSLFETAEIARVCVRKAHRKRGLGGALLDAYERKVRSLGAERIFLEVRVSNAAALSLYESRGFTRQRVREKYYADGEAAVEMKKEL